MYDNNFLNMGHRYILQAKQFKAKQFKVKQFKESRSKKAVQSKQFKVVNEKKNTNVLNLIY